MISRVKAIPRSLAIAKVEEILEEGHFLISINSIGDHDIHGDHPHLIKLWFDDIGPLSVWKFRGNFPAIEMNVEQADQIIDFVKQIDALREDKVLFVHCTAGISRSGAVSEFCRLVFFMDDIQFTQDNPGIKPNEWIVWLLLHRWMIKNKLTFWDEMEKK